MRKGEDVVASTSLVLKGSPSGRMVCTILPNTDRTSECEFECVCLDPKGGELCLEMLKPWETKVEDSRDTDVQIVRFIWVSERKTHRTT